MSGSRVSDMGKDKIRYLLFVSGRWRWQPTRAMRARGFKLTTFGKELSAADRARAIALNAEWDQVERRPSGACRGSAILSIGTVGDGYQRAVNLRASERDKGIIWTKEHVYRDDWPRAWKWLGPLLVTVIRRPSHLNAAGPAKKVTEGVSARPRRIRVIKVWRALWKELQAFGYCSAKDNDPSFAFANPAPGPRKDIWKYAEVYSSSSRSGRTASPAWGADRCDLGL